MRIRMMQESNKSATPIALDYQKHYYYTTK